MYREIMSGGNVGSNVVYLLGVLLLFGVASEVSVAEAKNTNLDDAKAFLDEYNEQAMVVYYESAEASWVYNTNITDYNQKKEVEASLVSAAFTQLAYQNATLFDETDFPEDIKRQFKFIKDIGSAALEDESKIEEMYFVAP